MNNLLFSESYEVTIFVTYYYFFVEMYLFCQKYIKIPPEENSPYYIILKV